MSQRGKEMPLPLPLISELEFAISLFDPDIASHCGVIEYDNRNGIAFSVAVNVADKHLLMTDTLATDKRREFVIGHR